MAVFDEWAGRAFLIIYIIIPLSLKPLEQAMTRVFVFSLNKILLFALQLELLRLL